MFLQVYEHFQVSQIDARRLAFGFQGIVKQKPVCLDSHLGVEKDCLALIQASKLHLPFPLGHAGRTLDGFVNAHLAFITVGDDYEKARDTWVRLLSTRYAQDFSPLAGKYGIIGTAAQCAEQLERFIEAGCTCFVMNPICDNEDTERQFEQIAAEIVPRFAAR